MTDASQSPTVLTIILNWRTAVMTLQAVAAAERAMRGVFGAIIVVDNDSGDGSFETMTAELVGHTRVRVVQAGRNGGFGAGNNFGIRLGLSDGSRPDFVYILNSDAFPAEDAIQHLLTYLENHPKIGFAGSYIHGPDGEAHTTCFRFPSIASEFEGSARTGPITHLLSHRKISLGIPDKSGPVDWLAGASLMMRYSVLQETGLFDEDFFLYFEETDLCRRARAAGWPTHFVRESRIEHIGSVSTGMKRWGRVPGFWFESRWLYFVKQGGTSHAVLATIAHVSGCLILQARRLIQPRIRPDPPYFLRDLLSHALRKVTRREPA